MDDRIRLIAWSTLLALAIGCALLIDIFGVIRAMFLAPYAGDFSVFWTAGRIAPSLVYDLEAITRAQDWITQGVPGPRPFVNPPSFLPFFVPFAALPYQPALAAWLLAGLSSFIFAVRRLIGLPHVLLIAVAPPFFIAAIAGQVTLLVSGCIIAALTRLKTQPALAGVLFGIAATIKPQSVLLVPLALIAGRHWRALLIALSVGAAIGLACIVVQGPQLWLDWLDALAGFSEIAQRPSFIKRGVSPVSLAYLLGFSGIATMMLCLACAVLGIVSVWITFARENSAINLIGGLVCGCLLCSTYAMPYEVVPLLIPATAMLLDKNGAPWGWMVGFLLVSNLILPMGVIIMTLTLLSKQVPQLAAMIRRRPPLEVPPPRFR